MFHSHKVVSTPIPLHKNEQRQRIVFGLIFGFYHPTHLQYNIWWKNIWLSALEGLRKYIYNFDESLED